MLNNLSGDISPSSKAPQPEIPMTPPASSQQATFGELPLTQRWTSEGRGRESGSSEEEMESSLSGEEEEEEEEGMAVVAETFSGEDSDMLLLSVGGSGAAREAEAAMVELAGTISSALTQYREQFDRWETLRPNPPLSAIRASLLIDQGLARFVYVLEPFKAAADLLASLAGLLHDFGSLLTRSQLDHPTKLWSGLCGLDDQLGVVMDGFRSGMNEVEELHDWLDGVLTPALAEVKFQGGGRDEGDEDTSMLSRILDVHSYLCESLVTAGSVLGVYRTGLQHVQRLVGSLQSSLLAPDDDTHFRGLLPHAASWAQNTAASLLSSVNALAVFSSISACLQFHSHGGLSSRCNDLAQQDRKSVV